MPRIVTLILLASLAACATKRPAQPNVLAGRSYFLFVWSNCPEGKAGCDRLSGEIMPAGTGTTFRLTGSTHMVKCTDGVSPWHIGYYKLTGAGFSVLAYPNGTLEVTPPTGPPVTEKGYWLDY